MATATINRPVSNIAVAFAAQSVSSNIPIARDGSYASGPEQARMLLTPPNSISPTLAAHKHRPGVPLAGSQRAPSHVESDIDLMDAVEHAKAQDLPSSSLSREALAGVEAAGQITATMLAKYHLPKIFMGHGSMPVRDIMSHLAQSVPGYSRIPPAKARRLVVAALEHRAGGGLHGEVVFEKVGWGRWHVKGQNNNGQGLPIKGQNAPRSGPTPPASVDSAGGLANFRLRNNQDGYSGSWAAGSTGSNHDEEMADAMSLDGSEGSESESESEMDLEHDPMDDETDDEDWSAIGPDALRRGSRGHRVESRDYNYLSRLNTAQMRSAPSQSVPLSRAGHATPAFNTTNSTSFSASRTNTGNLHASSGVLGNTSEQAAIEALIAMGSM
ncbi:putative Sin3 binding protein-domain-containing protein [Dendryphion nanum]|uniref:Sin3 binding protein-domain-containing protein n=1 Tax=Dendryphion nanum TaxID=256645 RepID=A0A9P9EC50_9PLEO|nr:putative Sin3 binding protein-domain-containing protein [Dendryphion nanum]